MHKRPLHACAMHASRPLLAEDKPLKSALQNGGAGAASKAEPAGPEEQASGIEQAEAPPAQPQAPPSLTPAQVRAS